MLYLLLRTLLSPSPMARKDAKGKAFDCASHHRYRAIFLDQGEPWWNLQTWLLSVLPLISDACGFWMFYPSDLWVLFPSLAWSISPTLWSLTGFFLVKSPPVAHISLSRSRPPVQTLGVDWHWQVKHLFSASYTEYVYNRFVFRVFVSSFIILFLTIGHCNFFVFGFPQSPENRSSV